MNTQEIGLIRDICHQVDCLVTEDLGTTNLEVLESARLKMNDLLWKKKYLEAEQLACAISLVHSGQQAESYLLEQLGC